MLKKWLHEQEAHSERGGSVHLTSM